MKQVCHGLAEGNSRHTSREEEERCPHGLADNMAWYSTMLPLWTKQDLIFSSLWRLNEKPIAQAWSMK